MMSRRLVTALVVGGAIAGIIDIGAAALINMVGLDVIMRAIARGLLGNSAMTGGAPTAILGFVLQVFMGVLIALIYGFAARVFPRLAQRWPPAGLLYGVVVFIVMNYVVMPLSRVAHFPKFTPVSFVTNLLAMLLFGLVIAYAYVRGTKPAEPAAA